MTFSPRKPRPDDVRVIVDPSNARKDYTLPKNIAEGLYEQGLLAYDLTNGAYYDKGATKVDR
jgi:hypothetical protein